MHRTDLDRYLDQRKQARPSQHVEFKDFPEFLLGGPPLPTQNRFLWSEERMRAYKGPAGCAKTNTLACIAFMRALFQPGAAIFVSRHDYNDLLTTTAVEFEKMLHRLPAGTLLGRDKSAPMRWWIRPAIPGGEPSLITFMGLKDKVVGANAHVWLIDEADEVEEGRIHDIDFRLRKEGSTSHVLALAFNPPDKHHWLYRACTGRDHRERKVAEPYLALFEPIPNENEANLTPNYYVDKARGKPEDWIARYIRGEWGATFEGDPVYREFHWNLHSRPALEYDPALPLLRAWDFGYRHPVCLWAQMTPFGNLRLLLEEIGLNEEATPFARRIRSITARRFPQAREIEDYGDPAVRQHKDTGSTLIELFKLGITMRYRLCPDLLEGVDLIRRTFLELAEGEPRILISREGCPVLLSAIKGGYHLDNRTGNKPIKDGFYDNPADAFRYLGWNVFGGGESLQAQASQVPDSLEYDPLQDVYGRVAPSGGVSFDEFSKWLKTLPGEE